MIFGELGLWFDPLARNGSEAMAVDEWLLEQGKHPILRIYRWAGAWGSVGYFGKLKEAQRALPDISFVRRWTGGGTVDHREDWTYSLIVPRGSEVARMKGGESYRVIHRILCEVLRAEGGSPDLLTGQGKPGGLCFKSPVEHDLVNAEGAKLAGAAQRRGRFGLLHQGSVASAGDSRLRGEVFAEHLADSWWEMDLALDESRVASLVEGKYGRADWLARS